MQHGQQSLALILFQWCAITTTQTVEVAQNSKSPWTHAISQTTSFGLPGRLWGDLDQKPSRKYCSSRVRQARVSHMPQQCLFASLQISKAYSTEFEEICGSFRKMGFVGFFWILLTYQNKTFFHRLKLNFPHFHNVFSTEENNIHSTS